MEAITKKCSKCGEVKSLSVFYKRKDIKSWVGAWCKACENTNRKPYRKAYQKAYHKANADKLRESRKAYKKANADKIAEYHKANVDNLTSRYIASNIGLPIEDIPPELIELKRAQLKLHRLIKQKTIT